MAKRLDSAARAAVALANVAEGDRVLDVACGTGNAALLAASSGAHVTGLDVEPSLLAQARVRADERGVVVAWVRGDAVELPFPDGTFSVVLSVFGVMYAPDQQRAARELARVCAPGARVVLAFALAVKGAVGAVWLAVVGDHGICEKALCGPGRPLRSAG
jgi:ubiquinone/menaquinone biosynthesis C-methylase UbiE